MFTALSPQIICSASLDAGNASMLRAGRTVWNADDLDAAALASDELWNCYENRNLGIEPAPLKLSPDYDTRFEDGAWRCGCPSFHFAKGRPGDLSKICKHIKLARNQ